MKIDRTVKYRVTCISKEYVHTMTTLQTDSISETFKEVMAEKRGTAQHIKSIEFEPMNGIATPNYIV